MNDERLHFLFGQYTANRISKAELLELQTRLAQTADDTALRQRIAAEFQHTPLGDDTVGKGEAWLDGLETQVWEKIAQTPAEYPVRRLFPWRKAIAIAASVLIVATVAIWLFLDDQTNPTAEIVNLKSEDIAPGGNRATLTLADGRTIDLSEAQTGIVVGDERITYGDRTSIVMLSAAEASPTPQTLVLTTPKGGTYQITLPDGTKVWLNAASTLKYPSRFDEDERIVELIGEGYFDVAKLEGTRVSHVPFKVISNNQTVEVLGTHFNISAYPDEPETKTTLVEGSVRLRVGATGASVSLVPGEQGRLANGAIDVKQVDVAQFTAWRHNQFVFQQTSLHDILQQLQRWYAVKVDLANVPSETFYGRIDRNVPLSAVLDMLADASDYTFEIKERRLTISRK